MGHDPISHTPNINVSRVEADEAQDKEVRSEARQVASEESFESACEQLFNPWAADKDKGEKFRTLNDRKADIKELAKEAQKTAASAKLNDSSLKYQQKNPELSAKSLIRLLQSLKHNDTLDEVLKKVQDFFPDPSLADDALDFLIENSEGDLSKTLSDAKLEHGKRFGRQIVAGKNIAEQARTFSTQGLGSPTALRDLYRDVTGNPREPVQLFDQLSKAYTFEQLKTVIQFLLHALGSDLKNKGPSIPRGELARLFTETRSLQAILGVYRFFQTRMRLINQGYKQAGISVPQGLNFEVLSKAFMKLVDDRYPASPKIIKSAEQLALERDLLALIIIISQWRDATRNVSPRLFKLLKQRDDLLEAILKSLEELEDELEKDSEDEEKK